MVTSRNSRDSFPWLKDKTTQFQSFKTSCWFLPNGLLCGIFHAFGGGKRHRRVCVLLAWRLAQFPTRGLQRDVVGLCDRRRDEASNQGHSANASSINAWSCAQRVVDHVLDADT